MSDDKEQSEITPWPRGSTWGRDLRAWGGQGRDGVVRVASALWGVFQSTEEGPPLVTGETEEEAMSAFAQQLARDHPENNDPRGLVHELLFFGEVFCRSCVVAYAFANSAEILEPTPSWISGEDVRLAVEAERERCAKLLEAHTAKLEQEISRYRSSLNEHSDMAWARECLESVRAQIATAKRYAEEIRLDPGESPSKP